ncbi:EamA family transporter [Plectonema cf. radiosum LEGE 06105]|uniref:EamA family transporter n=1 Tax=Plectonema cf. radiosum LEGE 06105 TaxID=945769 RepID=A0A8J7F7P3_9CYAN|nr:EamA family transporter [Plectonema radiosum]MBE9216318.1 EamA family transporter [Plectonema cf. radiosum LEGE 06105]
MGRFDNGPEKPRRADEPYGSAESALQALTEELQIIQRNLLKSLRDDVQRLQSEKIRLADDIKRLQEQREQLQGGRQIDELQVLMRQLAQVLGNHISVQLQASLEKLANRSTGNTTLQSETYTQTQNQESVSNAFNTAFNTLQQDLEDYQSSLSQQLSRMSLQQEQGEAILVELVNRLRQELESTTKRRSQRKFQVYEPLEELEEVEEIEEIDPFPDFLDSETEASEQQTFSSSLFEEQNEITPPPADTTTATSTVRGANVSLPETYPQTASEVPRQPTTTQQPLSGEIQAFWQRPKGLLLIILSTVATSIYNVAIKVIFEPNSQIFGVFALKQLISPTLGNCFLILMLRMLVVVPLMLVLAPILHPRVWQDLQNLIESLRGNPTPANITAKRVLMLSVISGCFLFLSQVMLYIAISQVFTGMAIALLFVYPIVSGLLSWLLFRESPSKFRAFAYGTIVLGMVLVLGGAASGTGNLSLGSTTGIIAGISFAFYVILTRICAARLHPVSFTLINFVTMLFLCFIGLMLPLPTAWRLNINSVNFLELVLSAFILGVLTLCGYLLNNFGIRKLGATRAGLIGSTVPALTVIFAGIIIQETLPLIQVLGVLLVTFGAAAFSIEKLQQQRVKSSRSS